MDITVEVSIYPIFGKIKEYRQKWTAFLQGPITFMQRNEAGTAWSRKR